MAILITSADTTRSFLRGITKGEIEPEYTYESIYSSKSNK